jgi:hypothetical protein
MGDKRDNKWFWIIGGIFDPKKAGIIGQFIMKAVAKQSEYSDTIDDSKIVQLVEAMRT